MPGKEKSVKQDHALAHKYQAPQQLQSQPIRLPDYESLIGLQHAIADPAHARPADLLALQRTVGNRAVSRLIQACLKVGPAADRYELEADRVAEQVMNRPAVPRTLPGSQGLGPAQVGRPLAQRQAEEEGVETKPLAATVTPLVQRQEDEEEIQTKSFVQRQEDEEEIQTKPFVQRQEDEEEIQAKPFVQRREDAEEIQAKPFVQRQEDAEEIQTKPFVQRQEAPRSRHSGTSEEDLQAKPFMQRRGDGAFEAGPALESHLAAEEGAGSPLPAGARALMEPRFGTDFSRVRVHTGGEAAQLNRALNAKAFTHGQNIYFNSGEYSPEAPAGQRLLAHELTHTLQQGASRRIQGWWPLGHKTVTEKAIQDSPELKSFFNKDQIAYLVKRSPDMDFMQDETTAMEAGIAASKPKIKEFKKKANSRKLEDRAVAKRMWENNELHNRPQWYMLHHGEGGFYKDDEATAAAKNREITDQMVDMAATLYIAGKQEAGLSMLSDAVHQAEDRGSHREGQRLIGHDIRQTIGKNYVRRLDDPDPGPEDYVFRSKPDPDNAAVNTKGAELALRFAWSALNDFRERVVGANLEAKQKESLHVRHTKVFAGKKVGRITSTSAKIKTKFAGKTNAEKIKKIKALTWKAVRDVGEGGLAGEGKEAERELVRKSLLNYLHAWITSELMERIRKRDRAGKQPSGWKNYRKYLIDIARKEMDGIAAEYPEILSDEDKEEFGEQWIIRAVENYEYQRATRYKDETKYHRGAEALQD